MSKPVKESKITNFEGLVDQFRERKRKIVGFFMKNEVSPKKNRHLLKEKGYQRWNHVQSK